ncbi:hypothetical protein AB0F03_34970 [Streptomyces sp. NPDC028722]|uniref:hypothetical protein n=1 Tax=Streptomyces sp. NPDC028722 TaxID=3155016 RepID=UPI0033DFB58C
MTDESGNDSEDGFLEGIYTTDIGLSWLASQWEVLEDAYNEYVRSHPDGCPVMVWLAIAEVSVEEFDRSKAAQLGQDVQRLLDSGCRTRLSARCGSPPRPASSTRSSTA